MSNEQIMIDSFVEKNGYIEDWVGNKDGWYAAFGSFVLGWLACKKSGEIFFENIVDVIIACPKCNENHSAYGSCPVVKGK